MPKYSNDSLLYNLVSVGRIKLILDELLEMKDNNETQIEIDNVVLSVAGLIYLINKLFLS